MADLKALKNGKLISDGSIREGLVILIKGEIISAIVPDKEISADAEILDLNGAYLAPGFIDLQIYGSSGKLFGGSPSVEALVQLEGDLLLQGTTGFLAAVATNDPSIVVQAIEAAKQWRKQSTGSFLGLHLEGPYLNPVRRGAHPEKFIKTGVLQEVSNWVERADGEIRMMTLAPELQDQEILEYLDKQGIILSCGHSNATYTEAMRFLNNPVRAVTHLYNAMPPMHHRDPGLIPAIFKKRPYTSIVADGIHVSFPMIELAKRELGDKLFLITDAVTSTNEGIYPHVFAGDHFTMPDGTLSGSSLSMLKAVQNCVENTGITLAEAVNMASLYPAELMGITGSTGKIKERFLADLIVFDRDFKVRGTFKKGKYFSN